MNSNFKSAIFLAAAIFAMAESVVAQSRTRSDGSQTTTTATPVPTSDASQQQGKVAPQVTNAGYQQAANGASGSQSAGQAVGMGVSGALIGGGTALLIASRGTSITGYSMVAAGGVGFGLSATMGSDSGKNSNLANQFKANTSAPTPPSGAGNASTTVLDPATQKNINDLKKVGVNVDFSKQTLTSPDGVNHSFASLTSPEAISKMSAEDQATIKKAIADANKKGLAAAKSADGFGDTIGGGGSGGPGETGGASATAGVGTGAHDPRLGINRDPAQIAGLQTMYNGEPIGVASDSLFEIVDRRYEFHSKKGSFLGTGN